MTENPVAPAPPIAPPPRVATPRALRRSWAEQPVRVWLVLLALLSGITVYFTISQIANSADERRLIASGIPIKATLQRINETTNRTIAFRRSDLLDVVMYYTAPPEMHVPPQPPELGVPKGAVLLHGFLTQLEPGEYGAVPTANVGQVINVKVDPNDYKHWTDRTEPRSWIHQLTVVFLLIPVLALLVLIAWWQRRGVLSVWQNGVAMPVQIIGLKQSAMAPLSRQVRFALLDGDDRRIFSALLPVKAGLPQPGDTVWIIAPPNRPDRAVFATLYV